MLRTRENSDVFNSLDEIYLVFASKKQISSMYWLHVHIDLERVSFDVMKCLSFDLRSVLFFSFLLLFILFFYFILFYF